MFEDIETNKDVPKGDNTADLNLLAAVEDQPSAIAPKYDVKTADLTMTWDHITSKISNGALRDCLNEFAKSIITGQADPEHLKQLVTHASDSMDPNQLEQAQKEISRLNPILKLQLGLELDLQTKYKNPDTGEFSHNPDDGQKSLDAVSVHARSAIFTVSREEGFSSLVSKVGIPTDLYTNLSAKEAIDAFHEYVTEYEEYDEDAAKKPSFPLQDFPYAEQIEQLFDRSNADIKVTASEPDGNGDIEYSRRIDLNDGTLWDTKFNENVTVSRNGRIERVEMEFGKPMHIEFFRDSYDENGIPHGEQVSRDVRRLQMYRGSNNNFSVYMWVNSDKVTEVYMDKDGKFLSVKEIGQRP